MKSPIALAITIPRILLFLFICNFAGCSNQKDRGRDKVEEEKILKKISNNAPEAQRIDEIFGKEITKICIQGKYTPREEVFEKSVGRPVSGYKEIERKKIIIWWLFNSRDQSYWIEIPEDVAVLSRDTESICHYSNSMIYFTKDNGQLMYNFERK
ncbi:hypothetical protein [Variovorax sp.]|uniref:hypothetical protein n=1 Tax=Variovorax sp. TaxID=1871043 RepID=UPI003BACC294